MNIKEEWDFLNEEGSGSTMMACEQLNRNYYMMELDTKYCEVICQRWEKLKGKTRELIN
jgi:site-specific DNA-methyltransferase (adenine-specific)